MAPVVEIPHATEPKALDAISVKNILFATDFSATSDSALPYATALCRRFGSTLHAAHVLSDASLLMMTGGVDYVSMNTIYEDAHAEAKERLEQMAAHFPAIPHHSHVRHGQVWKSLAEIVEEQDIKLIVVGTHGRTGLGKLLLGSVAEDILRHAPCPVLTVGPNVSGRDKLREFSGPGRDLAPLELEMRQIVCAVNFSDDTPRVAQVAITLAEEFRSRLTLMHVIEDYIELGRRPEPIEQGIRGLQGLVPPDAALDYLPDALVEFGATQIEILKTAEQRDADLIVLGARTSRDLSSTHLPSTAHHVIAHAQCPVLTVRG